MMNIFFKRLFNLTICHDYFTDGLDRFVFPAPAAGTAALLKNGNMLFKKLPNGITVLYRTTDDENTPFVPLSGKVHFVFAIKPVNTAGMLSVTDMDEHGNGNKKYTSGNILYFSNNPANASSDPSNPEVITHKLLDAVRPKKFRYSFSIPGNPGPVLMQILDTSDTPVPFTFDTNGLPIPSPVTVTAGKNGYSVPVDLTNLPPGKYSIKITGTTGNETLKKEDFYADNNLSEQNIIGIADIFYPQSSGNLYGETEEYKLQFKRNKSKWKYIIVNKSGNIDFDHESLSIKDTGILNGSPYETNTFERLNPGTPFDLTVHNKPALVFISDKEIPFYEKPKTNIQLRIKSNNQEIVHDLPNPSHSGIRKFTGGVPVSEIYFFI